MRFMKFTTALFAIFCAATPVFAQFPGINISTGIRGTIKLGKKSAIELRQQFQIIPEIEQQHTPDDDFFNEDGFWHIPDQELPDDDDDDDDTDNSGELNDRPLDISSEWRSTSTVQYNYNIYKWLRTNANYGMMYNGDIFRHTFRSEIDYRPLQHQTSSTRKIDLAVRTLIQYSGQPEDGRYEWVTSLVPRTRLEWKFKSNQSLVAEYALNGEWEEGAFGFDRWRVSPQIVHNYKKKHRFTLGYQYQQTIGADPEGSHGVSLRYEIRF